jgi:hypothetical protein
MPQPPGYEPYTWMFKIHFEGLYRYNPTFSQMMNATIYAHLEPRALWWYLYFNSLKASPSNPTGLLWYTVTREKFKWFNRASDVEGYLNGIVPTIFCGVSGFSIG